MSARTLTLFLCLWSAWAAADVTLPDIDVTGSPTGMADEVGAAVSELKGVRLAQKRRATVGDTLRNETGVTSSDYGPSAGRPIIRGLGGDRVRVLQNGVGVLDASGASDDHAVAVEPLAIDRIEIVRGPAALLYGSQALGGVVNLLTSRVPERRPNIPAARAEAQYSSNDDGRSGGLGVDSSLGEHAAVHLDASARGSDDYRVPTSRRVLNSQARTRSASVGASHVFDNGYFGAAFTNYDSRYGTVSERFTTIDLRQQRVDVAGEWRLDGFVRQVRVKDSFSWYAHDEIDSGETSTRFRNVGDEARIDLFHRPVAGVTGRFGLQLNGFDFSALGAEAFLPKTSTRAGGLFVFEERARGRWRPSIGARVDLTDVGSQTDAAFGEGQRKRFDGYDGSVGLTFMMAPQNALGFNASYTERAPNYQELFARGDHAATHTFEVGDAGLNKERARAFELFWRHEASGGGGRVGVFTQDFDNFIALVPTGGVGDGGDSPRYDYRAVGARLSGAEAEYRWGLPVHVPGGVIEFSARADLVHGENRDTGEPLPRMTPVRETAAFTYRGERLRADVEAQRSERQARTAAFETPTPAYVLVNLSLEVPLTTVIADASGFVRLNNTFNEEARNHVSLLKDVAPLPGRALVAGLRASF